MSPVYVRAPWGQQSTPVLLLFKRDYTLSKYAADRLILLSAEVREGIKKTVSFSSEKLRNSETPPPSSNLEAPVFSD